jgi:P27 family predicted phage terminase small subunit
MTVRDRFGVPVPSPWLRVADAALAHCRALWAELGMTPASRSRVAQLPAAEASAAPSKWHGLLS